MLEDLIWVKQPDSRECALWKAWMDVTDVMESERIDT